MTMSHQWIESSDVLQIFPTFVWKVQLTSGALEAVNRKVLEKLKILRPLGADFVSSEGWQSSKDLHKLDEFRELASYIDDTAGTILRFLKVRLRCFRNHRLLGEYKSSRRLAQES
jgi:hypothetical protein